MLSCAVLPYIGGLGHVLFSPSKTIKINAEGEICTDYVWRIRFAYERLLNIIKNMLFDKCLEHGNIVCVLMIISIAAPSIRHSELAIYAAFYADFELSMKNTEFLQPEGNCWKNNYRANIYQTKCCSVDRLIG